MNQFKKRFILLSLFVFAIFLSVKFVYAAGLVPCGGEGEDVCTICHLIIGIYGIIEQIRNWTIIVGLFVITLAGIMWIVSAGGNLAQTAKKAITNTVIGIVIMLSAWLIIVFLLSLIAYKPEDSEATNNPNQLIKNGIWDFKCSTFANIGSPGCDVKNIGCTYGTVENLRTEVTSAGITMKYWECVANDQRKACNSASESESLVECGYSSGCLKGVDQSDYAKYLDGKIHWHCVSKDGTKKIECIQQGSNGALVSCGATKNTCKPENASVTDQYKQGNYWYWICASADSQSKVTCKEKVDGTDESLEEMGYTLQPDAKKREDDASDDLLDLLSCIADKLPQKATISSISDGDNGVNCYKDHPSFSQCSKGITTNCCAHKENSCHYGGNCGGASYAVDFVGNLTYRKQIASVVKACNSSAYTQQETNPDHLHVSVGNKCGCL